MKERTIKICLMTFNILCLFVGLATLIIGILLYSLESIQSALMVVSQNVSETQIALLSILMMAIGGLISFITFVGCCGAMNESKCMIGVYCILLFLLFIGQLTVGILGFKYGGEIVQFEDRFIKLIEEKSSIVTGVEETFECCGYNGPEDYGTSVTALPSMTTVYVSSSTTNSMTDTQSQSSTTAPTTIALELSTVTNFANSSTDNATAQQTTTQQTTGTKSLMVSESCCKRNGSEIMDREKCLHSIRNTTDFQQYVKTTGCKNQILNFINRYEIIIGASAVGFAVVQLMSLIAGCCLYKTLD